MAVIPKRLAAPKDHLVARLRFGTVSVMAWSDAFSKSGYRLAIHGSAVDLVLARRAAPICDLDLIAYVRDGSGETARTLVESLTHVPMIELKDRSTSARFGYHCKGESLGGTITQWSFTLYTDDPPVSTYDNVANSQIFFLDNRELNSKYGDIGLMRHLKSNRQLFVSNAHNVSRLPVRIAHREACGDGCLNPLVDARVFHSGAASSDPAVVVADLQSIFQAHFFATDTISFLRLFFFGYSRIERYSRNVGYNGQLWSHISDHIAHQTHLQFPSSLAFAHYLQSHGIVPGAFELLHSPTVTYHAISKTQAAWQACTQEIGRAEVMADFARMVKSVLGAVSESEGKTPDWVLAHSWAMALAVPVGFWDDIVIPALIRLSPEEKANFLVARLGDSKLSLDQVVRFDLSAPHLLSEVIERVTTLSGCDPADVRDRMIKLNDIVRRYPMALDFIELNAAKIVVATWIGSDRLPKDMYSRVIAPLRDRIPPSEQTKSVLDQIAKGKMPIQEIESFIGLDLGILERYVRQLIALLPSDPPTYLAKLDMTALRHPTTVELAKTMAFRPIIDSWASEETPSMAQFFRLVSPLVSEMGMSERLQYMSSWISTGKLDPMKLDEKQRERPEIGHAMMVNLVNRVRSATAKKKLLDSELPLIPLVGIRCPFTATSPEMVLGGIVADFLCRGREIASGLAFLKRVIPQTMPDTELASFIPQLVPIYAAPRFYDSQIAPELLTWAIRSGRMADRSQVLRGLTRLLEDPNYYQRADSNQSDIVTFKEVKAYVGESASDVGWIRKETVNVIFELLSVHMGKHSRANIQLAPFILRHKTLDSETRISLLRRWCESDDVSKSDPDLFLAQMTMGVHADPTVVTEFLPQTWRCLESKPQWTPFRQLLAACVPLQLSADSESWAQMVRLLGDHRVPTTVVDGLAIPLISHWQRFRPDWPENGAAIKAVLTGVVRTLHPSSFESSLNWINTAISKYSAAPVLVEAVVHSLQRLDPDLGCRLCLDLGGRNPFPEVRESLALVAMALPESTLSGDRHFQLLDRVIQEFPTDAHWIISRFEFVASKLGKQVTRDRVDRIRQWATAQPSGSTAMTQLLDVVASQMPRFLRQFDLAFLGHYVWGRDHLFDKSHHETRLKLAIKHIELGDAWALTDQYCKAYPDAMGDFLKGLKFDLIAHGYDTIMKSSSLLADLMPWFPLIDAGIKAKPDLATQLHLHFDRVSESHSDQNPFIKFTHLNTAFLDFQNRKAVAAKKRADVVHAKACREFEARVSCVKDQFQLLVDQMFLGLSTPSEQQPLQFPHGIARQIVAEFRCISDLKLQRALLNTSFSWGREYQRFQMIPFIAQDRECLEYLKETHQLNPVVALGRHMAITVALEHDNVEFLNYMLGEGLDPNMTFRNLDYKEVSIFEHAVCHKSMKCVDALLSASGFRLEGPHHPMPIIVILALKGQCALIEHIETRTPIPMSKPACSTRMSQLFRLFVAKDSVFFGSQEAADLAVDGIKFLLRRHFISLNYQIRFDEGGDVMPLSAALMFEATNRVHYDPDRGLSATLIQCGATFESPIRLDLLFIYAHAISEPKQNEHLKLRLKTMFRELGPALPIEMIRVFFQSKEFLENEHSAVAAVKTILDFGLGSVSRFDFTRLAIEKFPRYKAVLRELFRAGGGWATDGSSRFSPAFHVAMYCPCSIFEYCHTELAMPLTDMAQVESRDGESPILLNMAESMGTMHTPPIPMRMQMALFAFGGGVPIFPLAASSIVDYDQKLAYLSRFGIVIREDYRLLVNDIRIAIAAKRLIGAPAHV